jgi:hypothetical protein
VNGERQDDDQRHDSRRADDAPDMDSDLSDDADRLRTALARIAGSPHPGSRADAERYVASARRRIRKTWVLRAVLTGAAVVALLPAALSVRDRPADATVDDDLPATAASSMVQPAADQGAVTGPRLSVSPSSGPVPTRLGVIGAGFRAGETVRLSHEALLAIATAGSDGTFEITVTLASGAGCTGGSCSFEARGIESGLLARTAYQLKPCTTKTGRTESTDVCVTGSQG